MFNSGAEVHSSLSSNIGVNGQPGTGSDNRQQSTGTGSGVQSSSSKSKSTATQTNPNGVSTQQDSDPNTRVLTALSVDKAIDPSLNKSISNSNSKMNTSDKDKNVLPFKEVIKYIKQYQSREKSFLFTRDVERAFSRVKPENKDKLLDYVLSQLEKDESELIANKTFKDWEELKEYLSGSFMKLGELNLGREIARFSTLKQGDAEDI